MKRIMVNLDDPVGELVEKKALEQKRSASSYVALLVEADLRANGLLSDQPADAALAARIASALAAAPDAASRTRLEVELDKLLAAATRQRRRRVA